MQGAHSYQQDQVITKAPLLNGWMEANLSIVLNAGAGTRLLGAQLRLSVDGCLLYVKVQHKCVEIRFSAER